MKYVRFAFLALAAMLLAVGAYAQATGSIEGRIVDETKAPLPGVTVEATSPNLPEAKVITTDAQGRFRLNLLPPGTYAVKFTLPGFAAQEQTGIAVGAGQVVTLQVQMRSAYKEEVTVTGTLIPRPTLEAMAPVTTLEVEALQYSGINRLEDFLTNLPQIFVAQNTSISNGSSGSATVDLRGMGDNRTLVLLNGRRLPAGSATSNGIDVSPDLNFIPTGLIKRVDVLTGGASATYGADAVAGVVNFIVDKDFQGFKGGFSGGGYEHNNDNKALQAMNAKHGFEYPTGQAWDGGNVDAFAAYGGAFAEGKGHASVYIDYRKQAGLFRDRRDYYACDVSSSLSYDCAGSSNAYPGRFFTYKKDGSPAGNAGGYTINPATGNTLINWSSGRDAYNFNPANSIQRPDERWAGGGFLDYEWNRHARGYVEVMFMDDRTLAQIAPSADFLGSAGTTQVNCDNPMLSAQEVQILCTQAGYGPTEIAHVTIGRRNVEGGPRIDDIDHTAYRLVGGLKGEIVKGWNYDVYGLKAVTRVAENYLNDMNAGAYQQALLVTGTPDDPSTWQCMNLASNPGCVPMNIFKIGGVTQAALNYLTVPELFRATLGTEVLSGQVTADLREYGIAFPSASEGIQLALGTEFRRESLDSLPDYIYQQNLGMGTGGARLPVAGSYSVKEAFVEAQIPIIQGAPLAKNLSLNLGYRYSDYNLSGSHPTYKAQAEWAPTADFKFRVALNRATRAPNIAELFQPQAQDLSGSADPCTGPTPSYTQAQCALTGVTAAQYGNLQPNTAAQYNNLYGGNPNLKPEVADTRSFGIVLTPSGFSGFTAAFDYYDIKIKDTINSLDFDSIMHGCLNTGSSALCSLIHRDKQGTLWQSGDGYIMTTTANVGKVEREGVDVNVTYGLPMGKNLLDFNLIGSYYKKVFLDNGIYTYDCVGLYGNQCGTPAPKWRHLFRVSLTTGPATFTAAWRMIGSVKIDYSSNEPALADHETADLYKAVGAYELAAYHYLDLTFAYKFGKHVSFMIGVNNIADKEPPTGFGYGDNGYAVGMYGVYDYAGRYIHSNVMFNF